MTTARWLMVAGLSCLAIATAYLPPEPGALPSQPDFQEGGRTRLGIVNRSFERTKELIGDLHFRDSLRAALRTRDARAKVDVVIRPALPVSSQQDFRAAVERVVAEGGGASNGLRLLVVLRDEGRRWSQPIYVLPTALDGTCAVLVTIDWQVGWLRRASSNIPGTNLDPWLRETLGPCLYYAAFGRPGPQIDAWLKDRYFKIANSADWTSAPRTFLMREQPGAFDMLVSDMSFDALACTGGQLARCGTAVAQTHREGFRMFVARPTFSAGVVHRAYWPRNFPFDDRYLSELVREQGREKFARFWTSSAPVDSAFVAAFDQPIEQWTLKWARTFVPDMPPFGPRPRPIAVLFVVVTAALAVGLAAAGVMRRQVN